MTQPPRQDGKAVDASKVVADRKDRLSEALRRNLLRRKAAAKPSSK